MKRKLKISQSITGKLVINGRDASPQIQMAFKTTADNLSHWRECDKERFTGIMEDIGLRREAKAILESLK
jgi:hypothetical protein